MNQNKSGNKTNPTEVFQQFIPDLYRFLDRNPINCLLIENFKLQYANQTFLDTTQLKYENITGKNALELFTSYSQFDLLKTLNNLPKGSYSNPVRVSLFSKKAGILTFLATIQDIGQGRIILQLNNITEWYSEHQKLIQFKILQDYTLQISHSILSSDDPAGMFNLILEAAIESIEHADRGSFLILDNKDRFFMPYCNGYTDEQKESFSLSKKNGFIWRFCSPRKPVKAFLNNNVQANKKCRNEEISSLAFIKKIGSSLSTPIYVNDNLFGLMNIDSEIENAFTREDLSTLEYLRHQVQLALENRSKFDIAKHYSNSDSLTGINNRRYIEDQIENLMNSQRRDKDQFSLIIMDINHLKTVNDSYGHNCGDALLQHYTRFIKSKLRSTDIFGRFGGDEFLLIFPDTSAEKAEQKIKTIQKAISQKPLVYQGKKVPCEFCAGVAHYPKDGNRLAELIHAADMKMYTEKKKRK